MRGRELFTASASRYFAALGDRTGVAWSLNHQGDAAREQGDVADGAEFVPAGLDDFSGARRPLGDRRDAGGSGNAGARAGRLRDGAVFVSRKLDYVSASWNTSAGLRVCWNVLRARRRLQRKVGAFVAFGGSGGGACV